MTMTSRSSLGRRVRRHHGAQRWFYLTHHNIRQHLRDNGATTAAERMQMGGQWALSAIQNGVLSAREPVALGAARCACGLLGPDLLALHWYVKQHTAPALWAHAVQQRYEFLKQMGWGK